MLFDPKIRRIQTGYTEALALQMGRPQQHHFAEGWQQAAEGKTRSRDFFSAGEIYDYVVPRAQVAKQLTALGSEKTHTRDEAVAQLAQCGWSVVPHLAEIASGASACSGRGIAQTLQALASTRHRTLPDVRAALTVAHSLSQHPDPKVANEARLTRAILWDVIPDTATVPRTHPRSASAVQVPALPDAAADLTALMSDSDAMVRRIAGRSLARRLGWETIPHLQRMLPNASEATAVGILHALDELSYLTGVPAYHREEVRTIAGEVVRRGGLLNDVERAQAFDLRDRRGLGERTRVETLFHFVVGAVSTIREGT